MNHTTMCFSNVVGPMEEIGFYGHPMAFLAPSVYGQPQVSLYIGVCVCVCGYWIKWVIENSNMQK